MQMEERKEAKNLGLAQNPNKVKGLGGAGVTPGAPTPTSLWHWGGNVSTNNNN